MANPPIRRTSQFKKDYKRLKNSGNHPDLDATLRLILDYIIHEKTSELVRHRDHKLIGNYRGTRELHIKPDLLLIYRRHPDTSLTMVRVGSHSDLF